MLQFEISPFRDKRFYRFNPRIAYEFEISVLKITIERKSDHDEKFLSRFDDHRPPTN